MNPNQSEPREISRKMVRARKRRVCDNSTADRHFIEPGEHYERTAYVHGDHFAVYAMCDACVGGWDGYSPYPGSPPLEASVDVWATAWSQS